MGQFCPLADFLLLAVKAPGDNGIESLDLGVSGSRSTLGDWERQTG